MKSIFALFIFAAASLFALPFVARGAADVSFYGVFKARKYNQASSGAPLLGTGLPYRVDAVVSGTVTNATVTPPGGTAQLLTFDQLNQWLSFEAKFSSQTFLDSSAPSGTYSLAMSTVNQGLKNENLNLPAEIFPVAPHISNWTAGQSINPTLDFKITWDPFTGGTSNDYILVLMGEQATGLVTFRSANPFQPGALNGTNTYVVIPAATMKPSTVYVVEITFVKINSIDTVSYPGAKGIVGFNSFTDAGLITTTASHPLQASLSFRSFANAGNFFADTNATAAFPVAFGNYRVELTMTGTTNFAALDQVLMMGPPGSGLTNAASTSFSQSGSNGFYFSPNVTQPAVAPPGTWSASYAGSSYSFPEPGLNLSANLVVPVPTVGLSNGAVQGVTWSYFDPTGNLVAGTPGMIFSIQLQAFNPAGALIYDSPALPPATGSLSLGTNVLSWTNIDALRFVYSDSAGNLYLITYANVLHPAPSQLSVTGFSRNGFGVQVGGQAGRTYVVQFSSDLINWSNLFTTNLTPSMLQIFDPLAASSKARFYRTRAATLARRGPRRTPSRSDATTVPVDFSPRSRNPVFLFRVFRLFRGLLLWCVEDPHRYQDTEETPAPRSSVFSVVASVLLSPKILAACANFPSGICFPLSRFPLFVAALPRCVFQVTHSQVTLLEQDRNPKSEPVEPSPQFVAFETFPGSWPSPAPHRAFCV